MDVNQTRARSQLLIRLPRSRVPPKHLSLNPMTPTPPEPRLQKPLHRLDPVPPPCTPSAPPCPRAPARWTHLVLRYDRDPESRLTVMSPRRGDTSEAEPSHRRPRLRRLILRYREAGNHAAPISASPPPRRRSADTNLTRQLLEYSTIFSVAAVDWGLGSLVVEEGEEGGTDMRIPQFAWA